MITYVAPENGIYHFDVTTSWGNDCPKGILIIKQNGLSIAKSSTYNNNRIESFNCSVTVQLQKNDVINFQRKNESQTTSEIMDLSGFYFTI